MARGKAGQSGGKLIDTWVYEYQGVEQTEAIEVDDDEKKLSAAKVEGVKVLVKIYMHKKLSPSVKPPLETKEVWMTAECDSPPFVFKGKDVEVLRHLAWAELNKHYEVKWERYFEVKVDSLGMGQAGLYFEYKDVYKGTAFDGSLLLKRYVYSRGWEYSAWPGEYTDVNGRVVACIEGTDENEESLKEYAQRINDLRKMLAATLKPSAIVDTLKSLRSTPFLPALPSKNNSD